MASWYRTPGGIMQQREPLVVKEVSGHWYVDRDQRFHAYPDDLCSKTQAPTWARRETDGEALLAGRKR